MLRIRLFYLFFDVHLSDWLHSKLSEAVIRVIPDVGEPGDCGLYRTVAIVVVDPLVAELEAIRHVLAEGKNVRHRRASRRSRNSA